MDYTKPIELKVIENLKHDPEYRKAFFRADATDSIALQIRQLRKRRALNQSELAAAADMKQSAVSRIEQAEYSSWTFNTLCRVAEALNARLRIVFQPVQDAIAEFERATNTHETSGVFYIDLSTVPSTPYGKTTARGTSASWLHHVTKNTGSNLRKATTTNA